MQHKVLKYILDIESVIEEIELINLKLKITFISLKVTLFYKEL